MSQCSETFHDGISDSSPSKDSNTVSLSVLSISCHSPLQSILYPHIPRRWPQPYDFYSSGDRIVTAFTFQLAVDNPASCIVTKQPGDLRVGTRAVLLSESRIILLAGAPQTESSCPPSDWALHKCHLHNFLTVPTCLFSAAPGS